MATEVEEGEFTITELKSHITSLQSKIQELEAENAKLSSRLANCGCDKVSVSIDGKVDDGGVRGCESSVEESKGVKVKKTRGKQKETPGNDVRTVNHLPRRYVALKVTYFGQRFYGYASEAQMDPTVESEIFKALQKTRLLMGDKKEVQYSRCGRTDKGVSAVGQVIALSLRSKLKGAGHSRGMDPKQNEEEIDYVGVLNRVLPSDIRIIGWCPVRNDFSARFSCLSRVYKYFFWSDNLNLSDMENAGHKFIGEHDFRNFCKMDALNVHNYRRHITSFKIYPCDIRYMGNQLCAIEIKGSAFLWHQVRCMVAVLFMIGQGLESPDVIDTLLDTNKTPRKPQYTMAPEIPLVLHSCHFEGLNFTCSPESARALHLHLEKECRMYQLQAAIFHEALLSCLPLSNNAEKRGLPTNGSLKKNAAHIPLMSRPTEPSYEERRAKVEKVLARDC